MVATSSYFLFFTFSDGKLPLQFLAFALINSISGCLQFLGTQLYFKDASCSSQGCFCFTGWVPRLTILRLAGIFSLSIFQLTFSLYSNFPLQTTLPLWLSTSSRRQLSTRNFYKKKKRAQHEIELCPFVYCLESI